MPSKSKPPQKGLTPAEEKKLLTALNEFVRWILKKKIVADLSHVNDNIVEMPFSNDDWVMKFDKNTQTISFNTILRDRCSFDYYKSIILHEFFHLAVQKVPDKDDAVKIKDDFGNELMNLIDIEADFFTALFYKEHWGFGLVQYLKLYYEGSSVFADRWIRISKFERFIGTLLSISKMFIDNHRKAKNIDTYDLYLPSIRPLYTEESLHVLVVRKEHIYFDLIKASQQDFVDLRNCYANIDRLSLKGYITDLVNFVCKAFSIPIPPNIQQDINEL